ncbi:transferase [Luteimicrobium album]|uniref:N-acylneuraminate cytidylyltransferase n=1 Tax=Luteimicrobium album TaxID=1054550 RepID=A0ABQ6HVA1_9MICO|nr:transferase [Luteimicrobium album]
MERAVRAALAAPSVDLVVVSTDDDEIAAVATAAGARVVQRPAAIAGSTASSEAAVLHALDVIGWPDPVVTVLVQCTSPFIDPDDVDVAVRRVLARIEDGSGPDVVLSVAATHEFWWRTDDDAVRAVGHSVLHRPRRQDRDPHYRETGAFYAMRTSGLRATGRRFFGEIGLHLVDPRTAIEIDDAHELWLARRLAGVLPTPSWDEPVDVDAIVTDFDGVHTDDRAWITADGTEHVAVHRGDGLGVAALRTAGVPVLVLSTERDGVVAARARKLGVDVLHGVDDKEAALREWLSVNRLDPARVAYLGNDVNDLPALRLVGWPLAVADARDEVRSVARRVLARPGGHGAVRELAELVLAARGEPGLGENDAPAATRVTRKPVSPLSRRTPRRTSSPPARPAPPPEGTP